MAEAQDYKAQAEQMFVQLHDLLEDVETRMNSVMNHVTDMKQKLSGSSKPE